MKKVSALHVMLQGSRVGELVDAPGRGIYFSYDPSWLANGFNLAPLYMDFSSAPQLAADTLMFGGLQGGVSDSLPDVHCPTPAQSYKTPADNRCRLS